MTRSIATTAIKWHKEKLVKINIGKVSSNYSGTGANEGCSIFLVDSEPLQAEVTLMSSLTQDVFKGNTNKGKQNCCVSLCSTLYHCGIEQIKLLTFF